MKIRWLESAATRAKGTIEEWPKDECFDLWLANGWIEVVKKGDKDAETKSVDKPPVDRSMGGKAEKKSGGGLTTKDFGKS